MSEKNITTFDEYMAKCAGSLQKYISYILKIPENDLFQEVYTITPSKFISSDKQKYKLRLSLVPSDHMFDIDKFNTKVVKDEMINMINYSITVVWKTIQGLMNLEKLSEEDVKFLQGSQLIADPSNTTLIMFNKKNLVKSKDIRDNYNKRVGFTWA